jgi:uncharacterized YigZ family protein
MVYAYKTIKEVSEGLYKEKGSKFIAKAIPVTSIEQVNEALENLKREFYDARHHCYAYIISPDATLYRANDDGEPNHSAGDPILGQIKSLELTNTLVVVIRYFGGTKLGVSGLIHAYKTAAAEALSKADILKREVTQSISFDFSYPQTNEVMKLVAKYNIKLEEQTFETSCQIKGKVPLRNLELLRSDIKLLNDFGNQIILNIKN